MVIEKCEASGFNLEESKRRGHLSYLCTLLDQCEILHLDTYHVHVHQADLHPAALSVACTIEAGVYIHQGFV